MLSQSNINKSSSHKSDDSEYFNYYQPNFVLVAKNPKSIKVLSDIIPKKSKDIDNVVITTWSGLNDFILTSRVFSICVASVLGGLLNNATYKTYQAFVSSYDSVLNLPSVFSKFKKSYAEMIDLLSDNRTRRLWVVEKKLDLRVRMRRLLNILSNIKSFVYKFYLMIFVVFSVFSLSIAGSYGDNNDESFLTTALDNNSKISEEKVATLSTSKSLNFSVTFLQRVKDQKGIIEHTVKEGETVSGIAAIYTLSEDTIIYNNNLQDKKIEAGDKLYVPWVDGYVYYADSDIQAGVLEEVYKIDKYEIISINDHVYNNKSYYFPKDSLVLIPISDYSIIDKLEADRKAEIAAESTREAAAEQAAIAAAQARESARSQALSTYSVNSGCGVSKNLIYGFIWPIAGSITQCYGKTSFSYNYSNGIHTGLDIDGNTGNALSAVQSGTVVTAIKGWSGYGHYVIIDHGNGLETLYAHMSRVDVYVGQKVSKGQVIGAMGSTGFSTGSHLHFEVRLNGNYLNPMVYLP